MLLLCVWCEKPTHQRTEGVWSKINETIREGIKRAFAKCKEGCAVVYGEVEERKAKEVEEILYSITN